MKNEVLTINKYKPMKTKVFSFLKERQNDRDDESKHIILNYYLQIEIRFTIYMYKKEAQGPHRSPEQR